MESQNYRNALETVSGKLNLARIEPEQRQGFTELQVRLASWGRQLSIRGFGLARKVVCGSTTGDLALKVYVRKKLPKTGIRSAFIPSEIFLPDLDCPVLVDVEELERPAVHSGVAVRGASISRLNGDPGTLGCIVQRKGDDSNQYILSNAHVLAWSGGLEAKRGEPIIAMDSNEQGEKIAELDRWARLNSDAGFPNSIDAAIARLSGSFDLATNHVAGKSSFVFENMPVSMVGGFSGHTEGRVKDPFCQLRISYVIPGRPTMEYGLSDLVMVTPINESGGFSHGGDSGAVVVNANQQAIGLHFAGSGKFGIFSKIDNVFDKLDIELPDTTSNSAVTPASLLPEENNEQAIDTLARTLWGEARGEPKEGLEAVASVIVNRTKFTPPKWWGATIETVCKKPFQFSCWNQGDPNREKLEQINDANDRFRDCRDVAKKAVNGQLRDRTEGSTHYHTAQVMPPWARNKQPIVKIANHLFYKGID